MNVHEIQIGEAALASRALRELRPGPSALRSAETFELWIDAAQRPEGYRLVASFMDATPDAVAVVGFRHAHSLASVCHLRVSLLRVLRD